MTTIQLKRNLIKSDCLCILYKLSFLERHQWKFVWYSCFTHQEGCQRHDGEFRGAAKIRTETPGPVFKRTGKYER